MVEVELRIAGLYHVIERRVERIYLKGSECTAEVLVKARARWPCRIGLPTIIEERVLVDCSEADNAEPERWWHTRIPVEKLRGCTITRPCHTMYAFPAAERLQELIEDYIQLVGRNTPRIKLLGFTNGLPVIADENTGVAVYMPARPCSATATAKFLLSRITVVHYWRQRTRKMAEELARRTGAEIVVLQPQLPIDLALPLKGKGDRKSLEELVARHIAYIRIDDVNTLQRRMSVTVTMNVGSITSTYHTHAQIPKVLEIDPFDESYALEMPRNIVRRLPEEELLKHADWIAESWRKHLAEVERLITEASREK